MARSALTGWVFLLPGAFFFIGWQMYPALRMLWLSFTDTRTLSPEPARWVGLANYVAALSDPLVIMGLLRAAAFTLLFLPGMLVLPLLLAVLIDRVHTPWLAAAYRLILLIPAAIPGPLVFVLWKWLYDFQIGPVNYVLVDALGLFSEAAAPQWLGGGLLALPALTVMELWWGLGLHTLIFLAGLSTIPRDLIDAARIDGAGEWDLLWRITVPRLMPVLSVIAVLRLGSAMALVEELLIFGGFDRSAPTYTWAVYVVDLAFRTGLWPQGYAAAVAWIGALAMMIAVSGLLRLFRSRDE